MRLLTHNFLQSNVKGAQHGYPLDIHVEQLEVEDPPSPINRELLMRLLPKLNYSALLHALQQVSATTTSVPILSLPAQLPPHLNFISATADSQEEQKSSTNHPNDDDDDDHHPTKPPANKDKDDDDAVTILANLHKVLFDIHVIQGELICPETGRKFPIKDAIPNMLLHADEI